MLFNIIETSTNPLLYVHS